LNNFRCLQLSGHYSDYKYCNLRAEYISPLGNYVCIEHKNSINLMYIQMNSTKRCKKIEKDNE
jgi:hypothetical protein